MKNKTIPDKYFYTAIIVLGIYFIIRLIDQAKMLYTFPLGVTYDYPTHLGQLFFLAKYGFHAVVPNWYNGFSLLLFYPPGWYFFALPIYLLTKNLLITTYSSIIIMFVAILVAILILGKKEGWSKTKSTAFFLLLFANTLAIGNYIRLGRVSELFALTNFVILAALIYIYKEKKIDLLFMILFTISYALIILGHPSTAIIFHVLLFSFLITRKNIAEAAKVVMLSVVGAIITSFWWYPFLTERTPEMTRSTFSVAERLLDISGAWAWDSWGTLIIGAAFLTTFYIYWSTNKKTKRELLFYAPLIIVAILLMTRAVVIIPLLKEIYPDVYMIFLLFITLYMLMKINYEKTPKLFKTLIIIALVTLPIASVIASHLHTPYFTKHQEAEDKTIEILRYVEGKVLIRDKPYAGVYQFPLYTYGAINYDIKTPEGNNNFGTTTEEMNQKFWETYEALNNKDCGKIKTLMREIQAEEIISYYDYCETLGMCGLEKVRQQDYVCLYKLTS
ncbi:MAG: 6-pyruvoyl-tetrahydropterin synthase-related protein [archaeon]